MDLKNQQFDSYKSYGEWIHENYDRSYELNRQIEEVGLLIDRLKEKPHDPCPSGVTVRLLTKKEFENSGFKRN